MSIYAITVPGEPVPQGRPRFRRIGMRTITYDPKKCRQYKALVKENARLNAPDSPVDGPVSLTLTIYHKIPKSASRAKQEQMEDGLIEPTTKPDVDNVLKAVMDALTGVWYNDDAQVVEAMVSKTYSVNPRIEVCLQEIPTSI